MGTRGIGGGYRLARSRADITVLDVVSMFAPLRTPGRDLLHARADGKVATPQAGSLRRLFDEVDEVTRATLVPVTLETLVR